MEYISSDTSVWIDFSVIGRIKLPFYLPYTYIMYSDAIEDELLSPSGLKEELMQSGLESVEITTEEFNLADEFGMLYPRLSIYDRVALAIAKERKIVLLTGDGALRKAASCENVRILGTIGVLDQLLDSDHIDELEYEYCMLELHKHNGFEVRLPQNEILARLNRLKK